MIHFKNRGFQLTAAAAIALHLTSIASAVAGTTPNVDDARERGLLESLIRLDGQKLSAKDFQAQASAVINDYEANSGVEGRADRISQAAVDLQIMTSAQAESLKETIHARVGEAVATNPNLTDEQRGQIAVSATTDALKNVDAGAQFSACLAVGLGAGAVLAASIMGTVYASTIIKTNSVTTTIYNYTGSSSTVTVVNGDTTTTTTITVQQGSTATQTVTTTTGSHTEHKLVLASSIIGFGIAGAMFIYMLSSIDLCN